MNTKGERWFFWIVLLAYAGIILFVSAYHESWGDEADVWLCGRDMTLGQLLSYPGSSGHPALWYLMVMPLAKLGLPYASLKVLNSLLAIGMAAVVLRHAPFPRWLRVLLIFSFYFAYGYAVLARVYALLMLLLFGLAALYPRRWERPLAVGALLFLLFNTTAHSFFMAGAVLLTLGWEALWRRPLRRAELAGLALAGLGAVLALIQLMPAHRHGSWKGYHEWWSLGFVATNTLFPRLPWRPLTFRPLLHAHPALATALIAGFGVLSGLAVVGLLMGLLRKPRVLAIVGLSWAALCYIAVFKYFGPHHAGLFLLVMILGFWLERRTEGERWLPAGLDAWAQRVATPALSAARLALAIGLAASCWTAAYYWQRDYREAFSGSQDAARFIISHGWADDPIAGHHLPAAESLAPYLTHPIWMIGREEYGTYQMPWPSPGKDQMEPFEDAELAARLERQFPDRTRLTVMLNSPMRDPGRHGYELVYHSDPEPFGEVNEAYYLYRLRRGQVPGK